MSIHKKDSYCVLIFFLLIANGCYNAPSPDYKTRLKKIPSLLIDHFPNELRDGEQATLITNTDTTSQCIFYMLLQYGDSAVQRFHAGNIGKRIIGKYAAADTNIVSVKRETVTYWNPEKKRHYTDSNNKYSLPIPFFENENESSSGQVQGIYSDKTYSGLSDDFMIYVYDFRTGKYWDGLKPLDYMPSGWENGYSKGIAISKSKNAVIYWFVVW